ncbi:hypothetical protein GIB67_026919 [Kingdonia uniflora]|uniref:Uncharacterized protein n=1 Tax=Kingdonia uniflora TaxID=39325 RepID=A0A7J7P217_9MAGN|nr:hypothetical protein GIB67_026919 [Kingdonia uniflora]
METQIIPQSVTRRNESNSNSPEFEFWGSSLPTPNLCSADELFVDGVLLPLDHLSFSSSEPPDLITKPEPVVEPETKPEPGSGSESTSSSSSLVSTSKRWRDIFKMGDKKIANGTPVMATSDKKKKKERKSSGGGAAELNINIWPFSRSHSAGNGGNRPKMMSGSVTRKVSSAPCSRSNSSGESKFRKLPSSPGRAGIHLGRNSPVWQVRRPGLRSSDPVVVKTRLSQSSLETRTSQPGSNGVAGTKSRVLNINVQTCIGYRSQVTCKSVVGVSEESSGGGGNGGKLFNLRTLFTKKVY